MRITRRSLVIASSALAAGACVPLDKVPFKRPLGLADITVRRELAADYAGTLRRIAAIGYSHFGFRLARMSPREPVEPPAGDKAAMVRDAGLAIYTVRLGLSEPPEKQMELAAKMGATVIAYTAAPVFFRGPRTGETTRSAFDAWLPELGRLAELAQTNGLRLAYHNHRWDHMPLGDATPLQIIARTYSPHEVAFEIDLAWAYLGGMDPLSLVRELGARAVSLHLKDVDPALASQGNRQLVAPGDGVLDYDALMPRLDASSRALGYVEVDEPADGLAVAQTGFLTISRARRS